MQTRLFPPHFAAHELKCKCGCGLCNPKDELLELAEKVRHIIGDVPMHVTSCCRCEKQNAKAGGVKNSYHMQGKAMDFYTTAISIYCAYAKITAAWERGDLPELGGIGLYKKKNFIHIDPVHASDGHLRKWFE
jgi:uncharacterized protein YcbK (DUF882 family)